MVIDENTTFFRTGAVVFLDALWFKGIWRRHKPFLVINKLQKTTSFFESFRRGRTVYGEATDRTFTVISDSIFVTDAAGRSNGNTEILDPADVLVRLDQLGSFLDALWQELLRSDPPLAYRGAIAWGDHMVRGPFVIGPAIDEAVEAEGKAAGAFIYLAPLADLPRRRDRGLDHRAELPARPTRQRGSRWSSTACR